MSVSKVKTWHRPVGFRHVVTTADASANYIILNISSGSTLPTDEFFYVAQMKASDGVEKPGFKYNYIASSGVLLVEEDGSANLALSGVLSIWGAFIK